MKAYLKGSAEEISFETQSVQHYLVFQREDGSTFRLPVGEETTQALVNVLTGQMAPAQVPFQVFPNGKPINLPVTLTTQTSAVLGESATVAPLPGFATTTLDTDGATVFGDDPGLTPEDTESLDAPTSPSFEVHDPSESQPSEDEVESL